MEAQKAGTPRARPFAAALGGPDTRQGIRPGSGGPRRLGLALDARGPQDGAGGRGGIPEDGTLEPAVRGSGRSINRSESSIQAIGTIVSPSALTEDRLPRAIFLMTHSNATTIDLWDTASGRKLSTFRGVFAPFAFRPDGKVLVGTCGRSAHRGRRPGHGARALDDLGVAWRPGEETSLSVLTVPRFLHNALTASHAMCGCRDWTSSRASGVESRWGAGHGWLLPPTAERLLPAVSRMAKRTLTYSTCHQGRRTASWPAGRQRLSDLLV